MKSKKLTSNSIILKIFCEIEKDNAKSKKKKKKKQFMIERSCYLKISDKKSKINYTKSKKVLEIEMSHNQMTNP